MFYCLVYLKRNVLNKLSQGLFDAILDNALLNKKEVCLVGDSNNLFLKSYLGRRLYGFKEFGNHYNGYYRDDFKFLKRQEDKGCILFVDTPQCNLFREVYVASIPYRVFDIVSKKYIDLIPPTITKEEREINKKTVTIAHSTWQDKDWDAHAYEYLLTNNDRKPIRTIYCDTYDIINKFFKSGCKTELHGITL